MAKESSFSNSNSVSNQRCERRTPRPQNAAQGHEVCDAERDGGISKEALKDES